jgi:hypothetical protein
VGGIPPVIIQSMNGTGRMAPAPPASQSAANGDIGNQDAVGRVLETG